MKLYALALILQCWMLVMPSCGTTDSRDEDKKVLVALLNLVELEYEDECAKRADAAWDELTLGILERKLERDKSFGMFSTSQSHEIKVSLSEHALGSDDYLKRKVKLFLEQGDTLLDTEQWFSLVTFGETALHNLRFATDYDCGAKTSCTFAELQRRIASQQDEEKLQRMKNSWEMKLPNQTVYVEQILPLLTNASKLNKFKTVEEYWDSLAEYEGAMLKARELWDQVKPLYVKLHKYVALRLKGSDAVGNPLPVHLLRSLTGDDWSNVIENLLPKRPDIYQKLYANLHLKNVGGKHAYEKAAQLVEELKFGSMDVKFWTDSKFDGDCPSAVIDSCKPNFVKVYTCKDVSIGHYLEAHENIMKIRYKEIAAIHSNNSYILREANRFSALYEAMPGVISLLALTPHALNQAGLYPLDRFNYNANHHRLILQLLIALRDLPRLNYYLAVDEWRLKLLKSNALPTGSDSWSEFRKNFSSLIPSDNDILGDPYALRNKPYIGKFMGLILKYQIYQSFAEELYEDHADLVKYISENNHRLMEPMRKGYTVIWPEMVSDLLAKREYGLESVALTDYFRLLDEYLDKQLDPSQADYELDYIDPPPEKAVIENEIPTHEEDIPPEVDDSTNYLENVIDTGDEIGHYKQETSTVAALEIKNAPALNGDERTDPIKESSYGTYWWIGIGVAIAVVIILIAIIARKRHNHRKQLEKQRRDNTRA